MAGTLAPETGSRGRLTTAPAAPSAPTTTPAALVVPPRRSWIATHRWLVLAGLCLAFAALTAAVLIGKPLAILDQDGLAVADTHVSGWRAFLFKYVMLGQRGPTVKIALAWYLGVTLWRRTPDALILFVLAELANNLFVGVVKLATGRWGPRVTSDAHAILSGGDIFPSGHVTNAVVLFGVLALTARHGQRLLTWLTVWIAGSVGIATVILKTHWVTDVLGGWLAGAIVLVLLPRHEGLTRRLVSAPRAALQRVPRRHVG